MNLTGRPIPQKSPKPVRGKAGKDHMAKVASLPCVICGYWPVQVHHVICGRFSQAKASDFQTIPLCPQHHTDGPDAIHNGKESWVEKYGEDTDYLKRVDEMLAQWF